MIDHTPKTGPWGLPVSMKSWVLLAVAGFVIALFVMGLVYELTESALIGPVSFAEFAGLSFALVWFVAVIGPLSPFRV